METEKGKLNNGLRKYNGDIKNNTLNKIHDAIIVLQEERSIVNYPKLMEITGLCRSTFNTKHVISLLKEYKVCKYKDSKQINYDNPKSYLKHLEKEYERLMKVNKKLLYDLVKSREISENLIIDLSKKETLNKIYLGKIDELQSTILNVNPRIMK